MKLRQHELDVALSLQNSSNPAGTISRQEINMSGLVLCRRWISDLLGTDVGICLLEAFSPDTAPRIIELLVTLLLFLSSTVNPFIYAATNRVFREEFRKLLFWWREADFEATRKEGSGKKTLPEDETDV